MHSLGEGPDAGDGAAAIPEVDTAQVSVALGKPTLRPRYESRPHYIDKLYPMAYHTCG